MAECYACKKDIQPKELKVYRKKSWHLKCLRKLRRKAKKKFDGNLDAAFRYLKERGAFDGS